MAILVAGAVAIGLYFLMPQGVQLVWYVVIEAGATVVAGLWARRLPEGERQGAILVVCGLAAFTIADGVFNGVQLATGHATSFPSVADIVFLVGYPLLTAGLAWMSSGRGLRFSITSMLETGIVVVVAASVQWALVGPDPHRLSGTVILFAYTVGDALLIALIVRRVMHRAGWALDDVLFLAGALALLAADLMYAVNIDHYAIGDWYDALWMGSTVMIAAGITAVGVRREQVVRPDLSEYSPGGFLAILGIALLVPPALVVWYAETHPGTRSAVLLVVTSVIIVALVFTRIALLVRAIRASREREIDVRRAAEREHARLASLMSQMRGGVLVEDATRHIALVNAEFCELFGISASPESLIGTDCSGAAGAAASLVTDGDAFIALIDTRLRERRVALSDLVTFADGRVFERDFVPIDIAGRDAGTLWQYRDVTERLKAADDLAAARDAAMRAAEAKTEFLATMSHEIRTPMYGVIGTLDLLRRTELVQDQRDLVKVMDDSARGLLEIINSVLDYSKLDAGKVDLRIESYSLRTVVESVADLLGPEARRKHLRLVTYVAPDVPGALQGDPGRVRQILVNLVGNAVKFTDRGDVVVRVTRDGEVGANVVRIDVSDTGPGILADQLTDMFTPFTQLDSGPARSHSGTGLGLAISRRLVTAMGGSIEPFSTVGVGTTLVVRIPLIPAPDDLQIDIVRPLEGRRVGMDLGPGPASRTLADVLRGLGADVLMGDHTDVDLVMTDGVPEPTGPPAVVVSSDDATPGPTGLARVVLPTHTERLAAAAAGALSAREDSRGRDAPTLRDTSLDVAPPVLSNGHLPQVLLVEDNDVNRALAQRQLEQLGVSCNAVSSGPAAIEALRRHPYALVLMDCRMPGMDGFEATRHIREREVRSGEHTPIVALTADGLPEDRSACLSAGMDDHAAKPLTMDQLNRILVQWLPLSVDDEGDDVAPDDPIDGIELLMSEIGAEQVRRLFATWKDETPRRLEAMRVGLGADDLKAVADAAHQLKSTCGLFGARDAAKTAALAEKAARAGESRELPEICNRLEDEVSNAVDGIEERLGAVAP